MAKCAKLATRFFFFLGGILTQKLGGRVVLTCCIGGAGLITLLMPTIAYNLGAVGVIVFRVILGIIQVRTK